MNWNADKSVRLSQACVIVFAALLLALDIGCYWAVQWFTGLRHMSKQSAFLMMLTIYLCSIFAWILLVQLWRLLRNIQAGRIFDEDNVHLLRAVSWCCVGAGLICLVVGYWDALSTSAAELKNSMAGKCRGKCSEFDDYDDDLLYE